MLRREWHAQGEQNARGSSMSMGRSITGLYIASLHEIEDNFCFWLWIWKTTLHIVGKSQQLPHLVNMGAAETHCINERGVIFEFKARQKLIFDFTDRCCCSWVFIAALPGHAAPPLVCFSPWARCSPWTCRSLLGMLLPPGLDAPPVEGL